ncbi:hypothetical protein [Acuticoccus mangrovi]|uniref:Uncharacterized protein n=1 Tax=Acuticoccus mangrovi TaxID=2796142 RepID=A0A934ITF9_9HYPH|nr:hypothetical protein [Acuticoccus mangrovi]MBJ3777369.1 hypothetical protein [Acuticoccus mangrovi]
MPNSVEDVHARVEDLSKRHDHLSRRVDEVDRKVTTVVDTLQSYTEERSRQIKQEERLRKAEYQQCAEDQARKKVWWVWARLGFVLLTLSGGGAVTAMWTTSNSFVRALEKIETNGERIKAVTAENARQDDRLDDLVPAVSSIEVQVRSTDQRTQRIEAQQDAQGR